MPIINIKLPNGEMKRGEILSTAPISQIKEEIFNALLKEENPSHYELLHLANQEDTMYHNFTLMEHDTFIILPKKDTQPTAVTIIK